VSSAQSAVHFGLEARCARGRSPYSSLENADSGATRKWIEAENKLTFDYLAGIPERKGINDKLTALWNYEKYTVLKRNFTVDFR
jgi:prolyl oligopeptidase PreP (S9A serine peptidase family)